MSAKTLAKKGSTATLKATVNPSNAISKKVIWTSSNKKVATVNSKGIVKAVSKGSATITVKTASGSKKATCKIKVGGTAVTGVKTTSALTLNKNGTAELKANVSPSKASNKAVTWKSSDTSVVTVSSVGIVKAVGDGSATITVTTKDGAKTATCEITVKPAAPTTIAVTGVTLTPAKAALEIGETQQLAATVAPADATNKAVSYASDDEAVATVDDNGLITAVGAGSATITVTTVDGRKTAACDVTVPVPAAVDSVTIVNNRTVSIRLTREPKEDITNFTVKDNGIALELGTHYNVIQSSGTEYTLNWKSTLIHNHEISVACLAPLGTEAKSAIYIDPDTAAVLDAKTLIGDTVEIPFAAYDDNAAKAVAATLVVQAILDDAKLDVARVDWNEEDGEFELRLKKNSAYKIYSFKVTIAAEPNSKIVADAKELIGDSVTVPFGTVDPDENGE